MSGERFLPFETLAEIDRGNGAKTYPLVVHGDGSDAFTTGISRFEPGVAVPMHSHNVEEQVTVLEGTGECEIGGVVRPVKTWDTTVIPGTVPHCFRNTGKVMMSILWIYAKTSVTRTFTDTGVTVQHLSKDDLVGGR